MISICSIPHSSSLCHTILRHLQHNCCYWCYINRDWLCGWLINWSVDWFRRFMNDKHRTDVLGGSREEYQQYKTVTTQGGQKKRKIWQNLKWTTFRTEMVQQVNRLKFQFLEFDFFSPQEHTWSRRVCPRLRPEAWRHANERMEIRDSLGGQER